MAAFLARQRTELNQGFQEVRHLQPGLTPEAVAGFLADPLDGVVQSLAGHPLPELDRIAATLYAMALPLIAQGWLGPEARRPELARGWGAVLQANAALLPEDVEGVAGGLLNALYHLDCLATPQGFGFWVKEMVRLGPFCPDRATFLDLGRLLAWRAGLAHYRTVALPLLASLPSSLVTALLGTPLTRANQQRLVKDPWWSFDPDFLPEGVIRLMGRVGGFRGFGGPFARPPRLLLDEGQPLAVDGEGVWRFFADAWGATLLPMGRADTGPFKTVRGGMAKLSPQGELLWGGVQQTFAEAAGATSCWADAHTCLVTVSHSHHLLVFARSTTHG